MSDDVKAWVEIVKIPTYKIGAPDKNPMFLEKRVYQGSSGVVYPYPVIDRVFDEKEDKEYTALYLENRYLKIMVLPEIGGRVQMAQDKTNGYHFIYHNRVIKPALVGLTGPWISGGIEFNWPQHHRPSTFDPLDWMIEDHPDGWKTVWCAEIERMFHTKGMHGFTLYPDRAYLEIKVQLSNRTSEPQTFLWWANPAVHVHNDYQTVFPPDVHAVMDHGKRDVSSFPIAKGTYYKVNYAPGTDISRYKNIPVPTSYMAYHSNFDFMGDYDHRAEAGMLHVANHHVVPGKKQWTWGNGDFGRAWDQQLTDEDGPYIELMCGAYTDNQPDFSWIMPGEEKAFTQIFMPYKKIGPASNANEQAVVHLEVNNGSAHFGVYVSSSRSVKVTLTLKGQLLYTKETILDPETVLIDQISLPSGSIPQDLTLTVWDGTDQILNYTPLPDQKPAIPPPASPAHAPEEIESIEELFLNGLHLEQYRHATYSPEPYYLEALRRDPGDSRCNNAMGLLLYRRGKYADAEAYFRKAVQRLTLRNPNPYDGESYYILGLALGMQNRHREAFDAFHKAIWNAAWQDAGYFELARLSSRFGEIPQALDYTRLCMDRNGRNTKARHLRTALLRRSGQVDKAREEIHRSLQADSMEYGSLWELYIIDSDTTFERIVHSQASTRISLALDYAHAGLFQEAAQLLAEPAASDPMTAYTLGWVLAQAGEDDSAASAFKVAESLPAAYVFPNRLEDVLILEVAQNVNPSDARAPYYLGNFWYAHRRYNEAVACWEKAREIDPTFPTTHRNLGLAYLNKFGDTAQALHSYTKAFNLDPTDARVFFELDQLNKHLCSTPEARIANVEKHLDLVDQRDDLTIEYISLLNLTGKPDQAFEHLMKRIFHPWEGGEGKVTGQYVTSLVQMARIRIAAGEPEQAVDLLMQAQNYPTNLGEGKLYGAQENNIFYYLGLAYEAVGEIESAQSWFERASTGLSEPTSPMFYNDQPPDMIFYQGLALHKLDRGKEASEIFHKLVAYGQSHLDDEVRLDYFAVSLPDFLIFDVDLNERNRIHCHYMMGLGYLGLGDQSTASQEFGKVLKADPNHVGAVLHSRMIETD